MNREMPVLCTPSCHDPTHSLDTLHTQETATVLRELGAVPVLLRALRRGAWGEDSEVPHTLLQIIVKLITLCAAPSLPTPARRSPSLHSLAAGRWRSGRFPKQERPSLAVVCVVADSQARRSVHGQPGPVPIARDRQDCDEDAVKPPSLQLASSADLWS